jgi:acetate CoA/acetoacetate CoA-transferase beta subunit
VIEPTSDGLVLRERAPGVAVEEIVAATEARLLIPVVVPEMALAA